MSGSPQDAQSVGGVQALPMPSDATSSSHSETRVRMDLQKDEFDKLIDTTAAALLRGDIQLYEIMNRAGLENASMTRKKRRSSKRDRTDSAGPTAASSRLHRCRHQSCTYHRKTWSDKRSRNAHESKLAPCHNCTKDPGVTCERCVIATNSPALRCIGKVLCEHEGCRTIHDRRHAKAHAGNKKHHLSRCPSTCPMCRALGWVDDEDAMADGQEIAVATHDILCTEELSVSHSLDLPRDAGGVGHHPGSPALASSTR